MPSDYALVVGCDSYPNAPGADLAGAVEDALAIRDWLLRPTGGGLTPPHVTFLASPSGHGAQPDPALVDGPASRVRVAQAVAELRQVSDGRRLYVYFAGHGCRTDPLNPALAQDALVCTDFAPIDPTGGTIGVDDLRVRLSLCAFPEVVVVVDACRNLPFEQPFDLGRLGFDPGGRPPVQPRMFLLQSTAAGEKAVESPLGTTTRGVFSKALTDALEGQGTAKVFDDYSPDAPYQVRWSSMCAFLAATVAGQTPRYLGEGDLTLASFPDGWFEDVRLSIDLAPGVAAPSDVARLSGTLRYPLIGGDEAELDLAGPVPISVQVPPRRHRVRLVAGDFEAGQPVDVYADTVLPLHLRPRRSDQPVRSGRVVRGGLFDKTTVTLTCADPAGVLELRRSNGDLVGRGVGRWSRSVPSAAYEAVLIGELQERRPVDASEKGEVVEVAFGEPPSEGSDVLAWASPAARAAVRAAGDGVHSAPGHGVLGVEWPSGALTTDTPEVGRERLPVGSGALTLPVAEGMVTGVAMGAEGLDVGLFDEAVVADRLGVLLLDRAQRLYARGRHKAAVAVLDALEEHWSGSRVAAILRQGHSSPGWPSLADELPVDEAVRLVAAGPWAVWTSPHQGSPAAGSGPPGTAEPGMAEPGTAEPGPSEPGPSEPGTAEPGRSEAGRSEASSSDPGSAASRP